jgi:hypothetical protein
MARLVKASSRGSRECPQEMQAASSASSRLKKLPMRASGALPRCCRRSGSLLLLTNAPGAPGAAQGLSPLLEHISILHNLFSLPCMNMICEDALCEVFVGSICYR